MSDGVALNGGLVDALEKILNTKIEIALFSQYSGSLGAALLAQEL